LNLNSATAPQLELLPGIGPTLAESIVAYREAHGLFGSLDDLLDVPGIGPAKLEQIRALVTVE
jgi:competence protein ComEA